jgi:hypothetical protein
MGGGATRTWANPHEGVSAPSATLSAARPSPDCHFTSTPVLGVASWAEAHTIRVRRDRTPASYVSLARRGVAVRHPANWMRLLVAALLLCMCTAPDVVVAATSSSARRRSSRRRWCEAGGGWGRRGDSTC